MKSFDPFKSKKNKISLKINTYNLTNAWLKGYEIIDFYKLIPIDYDNQTPFVYFDNASFPGSFIIAVNHYVKTQTHIKDFKWHGASLINEKNLGDDFHLRKNYPKNWLMNECNNGDITNMANIINFQKQLSTPDDKRTVNLYSCDLGLDWGVDYNNQESIHFEANICQILCGLLTLKNNGSMFIKHFTLFEPFTLSYVSLLTVLFEEVYISKPLTSKRTNSELYIVCKYYKYPFDENSIEQAIINLFIQQVNNKTKNFNIITLVPFEYISGQISEIVFACECIYNTQIRELKKYIYFVNNIKKPLINERCYQSLLIDNKKIVNDFKKINIKPISILQNLCMFQLY
jgi:cap2 methyltransferase